MTITRQLLRIVGIVLALFGQTVQAEDVHLGSQDLIEDLFSYPPNCDAICFLPQSLDETIKVYLRSSLDRDGYSDTSIDVSIKNGNVNVHFSGGGASDYSAALPKFLSAGKKGLEASNILLAEGRWRYNWRFYLPLGVSMVNNETVQLLHFPPDYVLEQVQDYLAANTTKRWAELLTLNGLKKTETDRYQAIVDIAPIAAPASDGATLDGVYRHYDQYIDALLKFWLCKPDGSVKPMVAFGGPVREYLRARFGFSSDLLAYSEVQLEGLKIPTLGANHPSRFYNALNSFLSDNTGDLKGAVLYGMKIAESDLIAACWQIGAAAAPSSAQKVLSDCRVRWNSAEKEICNIVVHQYFEGKPDEAKAREICEQSGLESYTALTEESIDALVARDGRTVE